MILMDRLVDEADAQEREDVGLQQRDERLDDVDKDRHPDARQRGA